LSRDLLRDHSERVREALATRHFDLALLDRWQRLDGERRSGLVEVEELKRQRNEASREIGRLKKEKGNADEAIAAVAGLKTRIEALEARQKEIEDEIQGIELTLPNLPHPDAPVGDESANRVERTVGEPPRFAFAPKAHWDLGPALGILD